MTKPFPFADLPPVAPPVDVTDAAAFPEINRIVRELRERKEGVGK